MTASEAEIKSKSDQLLEILPQGISDPDPKVRLQATAIAGAIGMIGYQRKQSILSDHPEVAKALLNLLNDSDRAVRENALQAIGIGVEPTKKLEDVLFADYSSEQDPRCRELLIDILARCGNRP